MGGVIGGILIIVLIIIATAILFWKLSYVNSCHPCHFVSYLNHLCQFMSLVSHHASPVLIHVSIAYLLIHVSSASPVLNVCLSCVTCGIYLHHLCQVMSQLHHQYQNMSSLFYLRYVASTCVTCVIFHTRNNVDLVTVRPAATVTSD